MIEQWDFCYYCNRSMPCSEGAYLPIIEEGGALGFCCPVCAKKLPAIFRAEIEKRDKDCSFWTAYARVLAGLIGLKDI